MEEKLENIIEAVLFAIGRYISYNELSLTLKCSRSEVEEGAKKLEEKYNETSPITLIHIKDGIQLVTNKNYYKYISLFVESTKKETLSKAAMETLTIIAYNPKITKSEIEKIRGVNSDFAVSKLLECGLIEEVARLSIPGRPAVYSVTDEFLRCVGIDDVTALPEYETLRIKDEQILAYEIENKTQNESDKKE